MNLENIIFLITGIIIGWIIRFLCTPVDELLLENFRDNTDLEIQLQEAKNERMLAIHNLSKSIDKSILMVQEAKKEQEERRVKMDLLFEESKEIRVETDRILNKQ